MNFINADTYKSVEGSVRHGEMVDMVYRVQNLWSLIESFSKPKRWNTEEYK
jgi:hypothetical protein